MSHYILLYENYTFQLIFEQKGTINIDYQEEK